MRISPVHLSLLLVIMAISCDKPNPTAIPTPTGTDENVILPPSWAFGMLYGGYTNQEQTISRIEKIKEKNYPIDAYWIDSWFWSFDDKGDGPDKYIDFVADTVAFPDRAAMWSFMEDHKIKGGFWTWDAIQKTGNEAAFEDFESRGYFKDTYMNSNSWHNSGTSTAMFQKGGNKEGTLTGNIDFDNPKAATYFKKRMKHFFDEGADFIKLDRTKNIATLKTMFEMSQEFGRETKGRGFMLSHADELENPEFKRYPTKWTSDTRSDWTIEDPNKSFNSWVPKVAFKENIQKYTDPENPAHTVPFLTNDTGGFDMGLTDKLDEALYIRWVQFSTFTPIMTVFSQPENPTANLAYNYSNKTDDIFRNYARLRMKLFPYIYSYAHLSRWNGNNMIGLFPGRLYQYYFGNELLVAPIYEQHTNQREVYLPEGEWINYWNLERFNGNREITVDAPIDQIPVFVKAGSIIPKRPYASSIEVGSNDHLILEVFDGANGSFSLFEDDGNSNDYLDGNYTIVDFELEQSNGSSRLTISAIKGLYENMPSERTYTLQFISDQLLTQAMVNGKKVGFKTVDGKIELDKITVDLQKETVVEFRF